MHNDLSAIFRPTSVAVVGASARPDSQLARPLRYLRSLGYAGDLYPVNPRYDELDGLSCYPSLAAVGRPVDLVICGVPASGVRDVVTEAAAVGARGMVVFAAGFAEMGAEGAVAQAELVRLARQSGIRMVGPNCQGLIFEPTRLTATFTRALGPGMPSGGGLAYVGQSGAVGGCAFDMARDLGVGLSAWASSGNEADLGLLEIGGYLIEQPEVEVLMLYIEALRDGRRYVELARRTQELGKHLVVLRPGQSEAGLRAVASHTGSMITRDLAFELVSEQYRATVVHDLADLVQAAVTLRRAPRPGGNRVGIVSVSGGVAALTADQMDLFGLAVQPFADKTQDVLRGWELLPDYASVANPFDVTAGLVAKGPEAFREACLIVGRDPSVDMLVIVWTTLLDDDGVQWSTLHSSLQDELGKPVLVVWTAGERSTRIGREHLSDAGVSAYASTRTAAWSASVIARRYREDPESRHDADDESGRLAASSEALRRTIEGRELVLEADSAEFLSAVGIRAPVTVRVGSRSQAEGVSALFGGPVAMKLVAANLMHKTELGAVKIGVEPSHIARVFDELMAIPLPGGVTADGVLVQEMADRGVEVVVGVTQSDQGLPPVVTVGLGGTTTELYRDVASATLPIRAATARALLEQLKAWPLLNGFRGARRCDVDALVDAIVRLGDSVVALNGSVLELEINPLIVHDRGAGVTAADFMMRLRPPGPSAA